MSLKFVASKALRSLRTGLASVAMLQFALGTSFAGTPADASSLSVDGQPITDQQSKVFLSIIALAGLIANAFWGIRWADPAAALCLLPLITREDWQAFRGRPCDCYREF